MKIKVLITSIFICSSTSIFAASVDENVSAILKDRIAASPSQQQCAKDSRGKDCSKVIDASKGIIVSEVRSTDYEVTGLISGASFSGDKISRSFVMQKSNLSFSYK
jgi:hypothetical protein